jgi:hypothetical protein
MAVKHQQKPAPRATAPIEEHRKHAEEFLAKDEYKRKPDKYDGRSDEAKP